MNEEIKQEFPLIEVEQMLFGDFRVSVWGKNLEGLLDKEYFCRGELSAIMTAQEIRTLPSFEKLDIWFRSGDELKLLNKYEDKN